MAKINELNPADLVNSKKREGTSASFPALILTQNEQKFYFVTMPVEDIFPYCFVASREENPMDGFQRTLSVDRARDIAQYLDQSRGSIPTNIVLSAQSSAEFTYTARTKTIRYRRTPRAFLVLDGQHRLYGYGLTKKKHRVPVAIYEGLSRTQEAALFIDINTNQRGVPAALLLDIKQVAEQETAAEMRLRTIFDRLNTDPKSPLYNLLSARKSAKGKISRVTFNSAVAWILKTPVAVQLPEESQYMLVRNYFRAAEASLQNPLLFRRKAYFEAFCEFFEEVARMSRERFQNYKETSLTEILAPLKNLDLESIPTRGRTTVTKAGVLDVLKDTLTSQFDVSEDMV
jgi:DGQHR domain-containing protein